MRHFRSNRKLFYVCFSLFSDKNLAHYGQACAQGTHKHRVKSQPLVGKLICPTFKKRFVPLRKNGRDYRIRSSTRRLGRQRLAHAHSPLIARDELEGGSTKSLLSDHRAYDRGNRVVGAKLACPTRLPYTPSRLPHCKRWLRWRQTEGSIRPCFGKKKGLGSIQGLGFPSEPSTPSIQVARAGKD